MCLNVSHAYIKHIQTTSQKPAAVETNSMCFRFVVFCETAARSTSRLTEPPIRDENVERKFLRLRHVMLPSLENSKQMRLTFSVLDRGKHWDEGRSLKPCLLAPSVLMLGRQLDLDKLYNILP